MLRRVLTFVLALTAGTSLAASPEGETDTGLAFVGLPVVSEPWGGTLFEGNLRYHEQKLDFSPKVAVADQDFSASAHYPIMPAPLAWPEELAISPEIAIDLPGPGTLALPAALQGPQAGADVWAEPALYSLHQGSPVRLWRASTLSYSALKKEAARLKSTPPRSLKGASDLTCIAVAIYHEARDQSTHGKLAVASVIQSRAQVPGRWGDDACDVVRPVQFSFMTSRYGFPAITETGPWHNAVDLALKSLIDGPLPELGGADHYHATYVRPSWRHAMERIGRIGAHIFYRDPSSPEI